MKKDRCKTVFELRLSDEECLSDAFNHPEAVEEVIKLVERSDAESKTAAVAELVKLKSSLYPLRPKELRIFKAGWMDNPQHPVNIANRRAAFADIVQKLGEHLAGGFKREDLPVEGCEEDCNCAIRKNHIGDRGGTARRVPCRLSDTEGLGMFQPHEILMVRARHMYK